jgi:hypothetical protein
MAESVRQGIAQVSKGEAWEWYGGGKTSVSADRDLAVSYGVKTSVHVGIDSSLSIALSTEIAIAGKLSASFGDDLKYSKGNSWDLSSSGDFNYQDSYAGTVGADAASRLTMGRVRTAMNVLVVVQAALAVSMATYATVIQSTKSEEVNEVYFSEKNSFPLSAVASIFTIVSALAGVIMVFMGRTKSFSENSKPTAALTMDAASGLFLGSRVENGVNIVSAGVKLDDNGIDLGTAGKDLTYQKGGKSQSIVGFTGSAGSQADGGSRLTLGKDGTISVAAQTLAVALLKPAGGADTAVQLGAQSHQIQVTDGDGNPQPARLSIDSTTSLLEHDGNSALTLKSDSAQLLGGSGAGSSLVSLSSSKGSLATGGTNVETSAQSLKLTFGSNTLKIDASGFSMNADFKVTSPGAPVLSSPDIQKAIANLTQLQQKQDTQMRINKNLRAANQKQRQVAQTLQKQIIQLRETAKALSTAVQSGSA